MSNKKMILILLSTLILNVCPAQQKEIDNLKKVLPTFRDTARVDCLDNITYQYILANKKDSALRYSNLALNEAKAFNYLHGIAVAYSQQSQIERHFENNFTKAEALGIISLRYYQSTNNKEGLNNLYYLLSTIAFAQSEYAKAIQYSEEVYKYEIAHGNEAQAMSALSYIGGINIQAGNYEKAFLATQKAYEYALKTKKKTDISSSLWAMAMLYYLIDDYQNALRYFRSMWKMDDAEIKEWRIANDCDAWIKMEFSETFSHLHQFDSAWYYYRLFKPENNDTYMRVWWVSTGECYLEQKDYAHAIENLQKGLTEHKRLDDRNEVMRTLIDLSKAYLGLGRNDDALKYGREGVALSLETKSKRFIRDGYQILSIVFDRLHQTDSANHYFRQYIRLKDEVLNDQVKGRFVAYNYEQQLAAINEEKKLQQAALQKEALVRKGLFAGICLLTLSGILVIRNITLKRKHERQKLQHEQQLQKMAWQQQAAELEMQALRAQMNPHFIFNSLNSINHFILQNKKSEASAYLTKFSRLVRLILQNSREAFVSLENEIESLQLYLQLEALRFDHRFDFRIEIADAVDVSMVKVPPLIIQPYAENAIWHGLMQKEGQGRLQIDIKEADDGLLCTITDDGIGRKKAAEMGSKSSTQHKSIAMKITAERIASLHKKEQPQNSVIINDLVLPDGSSGGTQVVLKIPVNYA